jgi:alkanesulfonate monooxygenase SsuD/methylene tetrahydromethanopterin reductase-like flavin-dependent oxidoreductase (luciferase family)
VTVIDAARQALGLPNDDLARAAAAARESMSARLGTSSYQDRVIGLGYSTQEVTEVSDRLVDAVVAHGDPATIAAKVHEHLLAGADHVTLLLPIDTEFATGVAKLQQLAPVLADAH